MNQLSTDPFAAWKVGVHKGKSLDSLYTSIIRGGFRRDKPEDDAKTRSVLGAVVLATNPLSASAIATLLGFDSKGDPSLLSLVSSLLILQGGCQSSCLAIPQVIP